MTPTPRKGATKQRAPAGQGARANRQGANKLASFADYIRSTRELPEEAFLGSLIWFSITKKARVTPEDVEKIFVDLDLDPAFIPSRITAANAFRKATGRDAREYSYTLADGNRANVLLRDLPSTRDTSTRVVIRERIDRFGNKLDHAEVGRITFFKPSSARHATTKDSDPATMIRFALDDKTLQNGERDCLAEFLRQVHADYLTYANYLYDQPLRGMIREYIRSLNAVSVRESGAMYFVHRDRWPTVARLTDLVERLHKDCSFVSAPFLDLPNLREMLIETFQDEIVTEVTKLVENIEERRRNGKITPEFVTETSTTVRAIQARAEEHSQVLEVSQDRTAGALENAYVLLASLATEMTSE